jgi:aryl carrier-like protein
MGLSLSAEQKSIVEIFSGKERYIIPAYQRAYSWSIDQCLELWDDIIVSFKSDSQDGYFLGNIVIAKSKDKKDLLEVIDGQQRLITLTLFFKTISFFDENNKDINEALWLTDRRDDTIKMQRIETNVFENKDNEYLKECLSLNESDIKLKLNQKNKNNFLENLCFFYEKIIEFFKENNISELSNYLLDSVYMLPILSEDQEENRAREKALMIFETINNRGLDLSDADIFKAQLYNSSLNQLKHNEFIQRWNDIIDTTKSINYTLTDIFRIYTHIIRGQKKETSPEVGLRQFFTLEKFYALKSQDYNKVLDDLEIIIEIAQWIGDHIENTHKNPTISKWLQLINAYTNQYPKYAIFVYLFVHINQLDEKHFLKFMQNIVRYSYFQGSTSRIKFEIFHIITKISHKEEYEYYPKNISESHFEYLGKLKNAYILLGTYLNEQQNPIYPYYFDKVINNFDRNNLEPSWLMVDESDYLDTIGNIILTDFPKKRISILKKQSLYKNSIILDVYEISPKLSEWTYDDYLELHQKMIDRLIGFFSGK